MLQHYGFEAGYGETGMVFVHRDYAKEIARLSIPYDRLGGIAERAMVSQAAEACKTVKSLNTERRSSEHLEPIPDWVSTADIPKVFSRRVENDVMRLIAEPNGEAGRSYSVKHKEGKVAVTSLNYPELYSVFDERKPDQTPFYAMFAALDRHVLAHRRDLRKFYHRGIEKLKENGFILRRDDPDATALPMIYVTHPQYGLPYTIPFCGDQDPIPNYVAAIPDRINNAHSYAFHQQFVLLEGLKGRGWKCEQAQSADGEGNGQLVLTRKDKTLVFMTYGKLEMFDMRLVNEMAAKYEMPTNRVGEAHYQTGLQQQAAASSEIQL